MSRGLPTERMINARTKLYQKAQQEEKESKGKQRKRNMKQLLTQPQNSNKFPVYSSDTLWIPLPLPLRLPLLLPVRVTFSSATREQLEGKGKERKGKEMKGKEWNGMVWKGKERKGKERKEKEVKAE